MSDFAERLISPISTAELERRWKAVRAAMVERGIDVLVMQNSNEFSGGYVKWFTDLPSGNGTMTTVIFPKDDLMTVAAPGPFGVDHKPPPGDPVRRGVKRFLASPNFMGAAYTTALDNENVEKALAEFSGATIGLVAQGSIGHALADHLKRGKLGNAKYVDATELVDRIMVIKSDEEIALIRATAALQDRAMRAAFDAIKPGMRDIEVTAVAENYTRVAGAEYGLLMGASSPVGQAVMIQPRHLQNRVIREGDQFVLLVETTGPGGFFCEIGRTCVLGKATQSMKDELAFAFEAQKFTARCSSRAPHARRCGTPTTISWPRTAARRKTASIATARAITWSSGHSCASTKRCRSPQA
jgi:Xaa-Pro aminopeptidase